MGKSKKKIYYDQNNTSPGPIYYYDDDDIGKNGSKGFKFSNDEKLKNLRSHSPGPGKYDQNSTIGKSEQKISMGMKIFTKTGQPVISLKFFIMLVSSGL